MPLPCQFWGVREGASNISHSKGNYTAEIFKDDFPQFYDGEGNALFPSRIFDIFLEMANNTITPDKFGNHYEYAAGLFIAHRITMYLKTYAPNSESTQEVAENGALKGVVKSASLGDASVTYDTSAVTAGTSEWGDLNATQYGQILASIARLAGMAGSYVI